MWPVILSAISTLMSVATVGFVVWDRTHPAAELLDAKLSYEGEASAPDLYILTVGQPAFGMAMLEAISVSRALEISGYTTDRGPKGNLSIREPKGYGRRLEMQRELRHHLPRPLQCGFFLRLRDRRRRARSSLREHRLTLHVLITSPRRRRRSQTITIKLRS